MNEFYFVLKLPTRNPLNIDSVATTSALNTFKHQKQRDCYVLTVIIRIRFKVGFSQEIPIWYKIYLIYERRRRVPDVLFLL